MHDRLEPQAGREAVLDDLAALATGAVRQLSTAALAALALAAGSLTTPVLSMEEGVVFNGTLEMKPQAKVEVLRDTDTGSTSMTSRPPIRLAA